MDAIAAEEGGVGLDRDVKVEEPLVESKNDEVKATYKSFKKKYRKMRIKFDEIMRDSNELCIKEQQGVESCRRLAQENDQLLDLLLDVNNSAQIPADKRIDLSVETPSLAAVPALVTAEELSRASEVNTPGGQAIYKEIGAILEEKAAEKSASKPPKSLAHLMVTTPHVRSDNPTVIREALPTLDPPPGYVHALSYLTPDQIDDYIYDIDASLGLAMPILTHPLQSANHELSLRNPHSVYNWLRRNEPKIFLQDGEGSEKSNGKPGSLRGAGKRASMPAPSKPDALEIVEEDGMGYDPTISGLEPVKGGKRKREDDGGYHPKLGAPSDGKVKRPRTKKKKVEGDAPTPAPAARKSKAKSRNLGDKMVVDEPTSEPPTL